jgi:membrane-bound lytic murein transglycosylase MltF
MRKKTDPFKRPVHWWIFFWLLVLTLLVVRVMMGDNPTNTTAQQRTGTVVAYYDNKYQEYAVERLIQRQQIQEWYCLWSLWTKESNWRPLAYTKSSGASGIAQLLPSTWKIIKVKPTKDGFKQVDAGLKYIDRHWGKSPCRAYASELARGWY